MEHICSLLELFLELSCVPVEHICSLLELFLKFHILININI